MIRYKAAGSDSSKANEKCVAQKASMVLEKLENPKVLRIQRQVHNKKLARENSTVQRIHPDGIFSFSNLHDSLGERHEHPKVHATVDLLGLDDSQHQKQRPLSESRETDDFDTAMEFPCDWK